MSLCLISRGHGDLRSRGLQHSSPLPDTELSVETWWKATALSTAIPSTAICFHLWVHVIQTLLSVTHFCDLRALTKKLYLGLAEKVKVHVGIQWARSENNDHFLQLGFQWQMRMLFPHTTTTSNRLHAFESLHEPVAVVVVTILVSFASMLWGSLTPALIVETLHVNSLENKWQRLLVCLRQSERQKKTTIHTLCRYSNMQSK